MRGWIALGLLGLLSSCKASPGSGGDPTPPPGPAAAEDPSSPPVTAVFVELRADNPGKSFPIPPCVEALVTPVQGVAIAADEKLATGDVLAVRGYGSFGLRGSGVVLVAKARLTSCEEIEPTKNVVHAADAPDLSFLHGTMHAHLDVTDPEVSPSAYLGRLAGTGPVAEHTHAGTWEVACAVQASGTFTLAGKPQHLGDRTCVTVPPDTKHSWQPDPGTTLVATQLYWPPGPEQRFKALAAADRVAGDH